MFLWVSHNTEIKVQFSRNGPRDAVKESEALSHQYIPPINHEYVNYKNNDFFSVSCHGNLPVLKALMTMLTPIDVGPPRLPLYPLKEDQILAMRKDLISLGCCENLM